jgi:glycosyltransferase involved in cell wall biosynthesis
MPQPEAHLPANTVKPEGLPPVGSSSGDRVLIVVPQPFYSDRGSPIAIREVVRAHLDLGHLVDVLTFPVGEDFQADRLRFFRSANPFGIRDVPVGFSLRKVFLDLTLALELRRRLRGESYQLVHALEESAFPAVFLAKRAGVPVLYDMHSRLTEGLVRIPGMGRGPLRRAARRMEEWLFRTADVVVTSKGLADQVREIHPAAQLFEWHFSGSLGAASGAHQGSLRNSLEIPAAAPVVLYSGTFTEYQGIDLFLEAAALLDANALNPHFVLVGCEPGEAEAVRTMARTLEIEGKIRIVDRQPRSKIHAYFSMADVLVSPRISGDNVPLKIFDYLAADRPIVATDIPTHRTLLDERMAVLAAPNPVDLSDGIARVLQDSDLRERIRKGAREYARLHLGWSVFVDFLDQIHQAAVNGK